MEDPGVCPFGDGETVRHFMPVLSFYTDGTKSGHLE